MKIGILGGGQLARMLAVSAKSMGIDIICIDPKINCSAEKFAKVIHCDFNDLDEIDRNFQGVDCVTYETENLPIDSVRELAKKYTLLPNIDILKVSQDRLYEKEFFGQLNIPTANYAKLDSWDNLKEFIDNMHYPAVIKTRRYGYDGKGQMLIRNLEQAKQAWEDMSKSPLIVEQFVPYEIELSLVSVRNQAGDVSFYPLTLNHHKNGILQTSEAPYMDDKLTTLAQEYSLKILETFNYVGVMTVEFFSVNGGLIVNEIAPRVHNSGHWTIEGADTSQFENHLRAIASLPLGSTAPKGFSAMINLIGKKPNVDLFSDIPGLYYHWYDKSILPNRKLGHITICNTNKDLLAKNLEAVLRMMSMS